VTLTKRAVLLAIASIAVACNPLIERYDIREGTAYGWILIDSGRPQCPSLREERGSRVVEISGSRYVCTSTPVSGSLTAAQYHLVGPRGHRVELHTSDLIHQQVRLQLHKSQGDGCDADVLAFYFGSRQSLAQTPDPDLERYRPDCRTIIHAKALKEGKRLTVLSLGRQR